jgi:hypothetical protein
MLVVSLEVTLGLTDHSRERTRESILASAKADAARFWGERWCASLRQVERERGSRSSEAESLPQEEPW